MGKTSAGLNSLARPTRGQLHKKWKRIVRSLTACLVVVIGLNVWRYSIVDSSGEESSGQGVVEYDRTSISTLDVLIGRADIERGAWIASLQDNFTFTLRGVVATEDIKRSIEVSVLQTYGGFGQSEIVVDPTVGGSSWQEQVPVLIKEAAAQLIDGGVAVNDRETYIVGSVPRDETLRQLAAVLSDLSLPVETYDLDVVDLAPPRVSVLSKDGKLTLAGYVPSQVLVDSIEASSVDLYGEENITNNLRVSDNTFARFAFKRWGDNLEAFLPFENFYLSVANGRLTSNVSGGVVFESNSAELTVEGMELLNGIPALAERSNGLLDIVGHADDQGSTEENLELSRQRAESVKGFFVSRGVEPERIRVVPKGDTVPIASNNTSVGRELNRRVQIVIRPRR